MLEPSANSDNSAVAAYIGAVAGTIALAWNILQYFLDRRVNLVVDVSENYLEALASGGDVEIRADIFNNGEAPVTIREILLETYAKRKTRSPIALQMRIDTGGLPATLAEGAHMTARAKVSVSQLHAMVGSSNLAIAVYHSRAGKPKLRFYQSGVLEFYDQIDAIK
jgi:hypothetical protein